MLIPDVVAPMLQWPEVVASGEITNWFGVTRGVFARGIAAAKAARKRVEGHNAGASYNRLNELSAAGISADHEAITGEEALRPAAARACGRCCASPRCGRTSSRCCATWRRSSAPRRRLMFTTDGAVP